MPRQFVDLSIYLENDVLSDPPAFAPKIQYFTHEHTFEQIEPLGELTLTWARFHAPSGYPLHLRGVLPDVCTSGSRSLDGVLAKIAQGRLPYAQTLRQATVDDRDKGAVDAFKANCPAVETEEALDLDVALRLIEDNGLYARLRESQAAAAE